MLLLLFLTLAVDWAASAFHVQSAFKVAGVIGIITALMAWAGGYTRLMMES
jgi:succinate-acetate transporter protein